MLLDAYERKPSVSDLTIAPRSLQFVPTDDDGNSIRVIQQRWWPMKVWSSRLDADSYVFATTQDKTVTLHGWLPVTVVEEGSIYWKEEDGKRVDYAFEVYGDVFFPMPTEFRFTDACPHQDEYGAIWNYTNEAWECCGCGRFLYNRDDSERIHRQDDHFSRPSGPPPPTPKGS